MVGGGGGSRQGDQNRKAKKIYLEKKTNMQNITQYQTVPFLTNQKARR